jgi:phage tail tube protein FII
MATNKTTKKAKAADSGILNYTGQGRTATEVKLPKLDPKAKQHHILFEMGKNDVKAELDKKIKPVSIACKRSKAKQVLKAWADANKYTMAEYGKLNVIVLTK